MQLSGQLVLILRCWDRMSEEHAEAAREMMFRRAQRLKELLSFENDMYFPILIPLLQLLSPSRRSTAAPPRHSTLS